MMDGPSSPSVFSTSSAPYASAERARRQKKAEKDPGPGANPFIVAKLRKIYAEKSAKSPEEAERVIAAFAGREATLLAKVRRKYCPEEAAREAPGAFDKALH